MGHFCQGGYQEITPAYTRNPTWSGPQNTPWSGFQPLPAQHLIPAQHKQDRAHKIILHCPSPYVLNGQTRSLPQQRTTCPGYCSTIRVRWSRASIVICPPPLKLLSPPRKGCQSWPLEDSTSPSLGRTIFFLTLGSTLRTPFFGNSF